MRSSGGRARVPEFVAGLPGLGWLVAGLGLTLVLASGCNEGGEVPEWDFSTGGATDGGSGPSTGSASSGGQTPLGGGANYSPGLLRLPFAVDDHYVPYGFMGAGQAAIESDPNLCEKRREGAQGRCHHYNYAVPPGDDHWAGLFWLTTYDNWGERAGWEVEEGATRVVFFASSEPAGAPVTFFVGGLDSGFAYSDQFDVSLEPQLSTDLQEYSLDLVGANYEAGVLGGFGFSIAAEQGYSIVIDDIRWE